MAISEILQQYKTCSTWRGYKTNSNRFWRFLTEILYEPLTHMRRRALKYWDISLPPILPSTELLTDKNLAAFSLFCVKQLHLSRPSFNKMVSWQNEASRDITNAKRREFPAMVKILCSQPWYQEDKVKRAQTIPAK